MTSAKTILTPEQFRQLSPMAIALEFVRARHLEVRADGTVWRLFDGRTEKPCLRRAEVRGKRGYYTVQIRFNYDTVIVYAHRLVWTVLRGVIAPGLQINHIDGNPLNNHPSNLEAVTQSVNVRHSYDVLKRKPSGVAPTWPKVAPAVLQLRQRGRTIKQIAEAVGVSTPTVRKALRRSAA